MQQAQEMGHMLEHITQLDPDDFIDIDEADTPSLLTGQASTAGFLASLGSPEELISADQAHNARMAFAAVTNIDASEAEKKKAILTLKVPGAVRHLAGMLSDYDWQYVEQAKEIRGYVVAQLLEESKHPDAKIRLKALQLLGNVTEIGAFTSRVEVTQKEVSQDELLERVRSKLAGLLPKVIEVQDAEPLDKME